MTPTELDQTLLLPRAQKVILAARCARVAVDLLDSMSLPVGLKQLAALEEVVGLAEATVSGAEHVFELWSAMEKLKHIAFGAKAECKFRSDSAVCQVVRAAHAAGMTAFSGSSVDAQDAVAAAFTAARIAESEAAEESLRQELRRARRAAVEAAGLRTTSSAGANQSNFADS